MLILLSIALAFSVVPYALFMVRRQRTTQPLNGHGLYWALGGWTSLQIGAISLNFQLLPIVLFSEVLKHAALLFWLWRNIAPSLPDTRVLRIISILSVAVPTALIAWPFFGAPAEMWALYVAFSFLALSLTQGVFVERFSTLLKHQNTPNVPLVIALGVLTVFDFFLACQFIINSAFSVDAIRWQAFAIILSAPFLWRGLSKLQASPVRIALSRPLAFHGSLFAIAGAYLLLVSAITYGIALLGITLNGDTQLAIAAIMILPLSLFMLSPRARGEIRVWINKHLFAAQYDYRSTWLGLLGELDPSITGKEAHRVALKATLDAMQATSGAYISIQQGRLHEQVTLQLSTTLEERTYIQQSLPFFEQHGWIIDTEEATQMPGAYPALPHIGAGDPICVYKWLIPVKRNNTLIGVLAIGHTGVTRHELNWETRDFLFALAQQMARYIDAQDTQQRLSENAQFAAFSQTSAFVIHDMKNVRAQLAMLSDNGKEHRTNPEFIDDAFDTIDSMLTRMDKMLGQLTNKQFSKPTGPRNLAVLDTLNRIARKPEWQGRPAATIHVTGDIEARICADPDKFENVLHHLIDNAQHAMTNTETPSLHLACSVDTDYVTISVTDNGCGMSDAFIESKLFQPFATTKGNAGMGIGVYDAKHFIASLGGHIHVSSQPGNGTQFTLNVPRSGHDTTNC
jgi:putative PEP-CTERM system histidine kinase